VSTGEDEVALADPAEYVSYEQWGTAFFRTAVTADRVLSGVATLSGQPIDFGPMGVGPGRIATVRATGKIGQATISPVEGAAVSYRVVVPVSIDFEVNLQVDNHKFHADLEVPLVLTAQALSRVRIFIEVEPPHARDITVHLQADGLRASIVQHVANVEGELKRFVAKYVGREADKPQIRHARLIDVAASIDKAWLAISNLAPDEQPAVIADLNAALETEIRANEASFLHPDG
jgi:hypothetical protein